MLILKQKQIAIDYNTTIKRAKNLVFDLDVSLDGLSGFTSNKESYINKQVNNIEHELDDLLKGIEENQELYEHNKEIRELIGKNMQDKKDKIIKETKEDIELYRGIIKEGIDKKITKAKDLIDNMKKLVLLVNENNNAKTTKTMNNNLTTMIESLESRILNSKSI